MLVFKTVSPPIDQNTTSLKCCFLSSYHPGVMTINNTTYTYWMQLAPKGLWGFSTGVVENVESVTVVKVNETVRKKWLHFIRMHSLVYITDIAN